ncbi:MAG TPA: Flp family type IVb pilin [Rhizobiaceae bacterium]|nr:Flp family type IVb pilin [Rhizobiaceae bacterium]
MLFRFLNNTSGATAIEYGLIAVLIALAIVGGISNTGGSIGSIWNDNADRIVEGLN